MILGIDIGYSFTKDSKKHIFPSKYTTTEPIITKGLTEKLLFNSVDNKISYNNINYWVGTGEINVELDKCNSLINKLCVLNCLYLNNAQKVKIVSGLPINQFKNKKEELRTAIKSLHNNVYFVNNVKYTACIEDVYVFPQCVSTLYSMNVNINRNTIIIDVGSRTVDIAYIVTEHNNPKIVQYSTYYDGMYSLYSRIIKEVNNKFGLTLKSNNAESIIINGLVIKGHTQDLSFLQNTMREHFSDIFNELLLNYPTDISDIYLCGGGSELIINAFKKRFSHCQLINNAQFSNALGYEIIGRTYWKE